jgi:hypothetical protein
MPTPINKKLYEKIKNQVKRSVQRFPSAYASGQLVQRYKAAGGRYRNDSKPKNLTRWFKEKWIDVKTGKSCGGVRTSMYYPYCRPSKRVSRGTPRLMSDISKGELTKRIRIKSIVRGRTLTRKMLSLK